MRGYLIWVFMLLAAACGDSNDDKSTSDGGGPRVTCTAITESQLPDGCTMSYAKCSDGKSYRVDCTGLGPSSCECLVNGAPQPATFDSPDLCVLNGSIERSAVSDGCGWHLE